MLKMVIRMNDDKITAENKYRLDGIYNTINHTFQTVGLPRMEDGSGALVFRDCGRARDFSLFGRIVNTLKRQTWFMDNVSVWRLCDSDDSDSPDDFNEEDLLTHYQEKTQAYDDLRRFFKRHRFSHRQGSGYISDDKLATADIYDLMDELSRQFPWIGICVNKIDVTNVGRQHDLTELLKPAEDIVIDTSLLTVPDCPQQETE